LTLDEYKDWIYKKIDPIVRFIGDRITPDQVSLISIVCAFFAGLFIFLSRWNVFFLWVSLCLIFLNGFLDVLDGGLARYLHIESRRGNFLDHVLDRYSDVFMLSGVFFAGYCSPEALGYLVSEIIGVSAIVGVLLTSYVATQAEAVGLKRNYGGLLGRADRMVILSIFIVFQALIGEIGGINLLTFMMILFAIVCNITAIQRFFYAWERLS
jgi:CDP-diacylglycerol--glycerol-3-phosphate 3-phosphatidyltransferase